MKRYALLLLALGVGGMVLAQEAPPPEATVAPTSEPATAAAPPPLTAPVTTPLQDSTVAPVLAAEPPAPTAPPAPPPVPENTPAPVVVPAPALAPPLPLQAAGRWEGDFNAALTLAEGSTKSLTVQLGLDTVYQRPDDKLSLSAQYLESRSRSVDNGVVTSSLTDLRWRLGGRYDRNLNALEFGFVGMDLSHDEVRQLLLRSEPSIGLGRHLVKERDDQWDAYAGLSWREDFYYEPGVEIDGRQRMRYDTVDTLFGEESTHQLAEQVRFKQKFVVYPGLLSTQGTRALLDAGLQVDINKTLSLSIKLQGRYDAWAPAEKFDLLVLTGLSVKFRD